MSAIVLASSGVYEYGLPPTPGKNELRVTQVEGAGKASWRKILPSYPLNYARIGDVP